MIAYVKGIVEDITEEATAAVESVEEVQAENLDESTNTESEAQTEGQEVLIVEPETVSDEVKTEEEKSEK